VRGATAEYHKQESLMGSARPLLTLLLALVVVLSCKQSEVMYGGCEVQGARCEVQGAKCEV
jgi:hypothetical protein